MRLTHQQLDHIAFRIVHDLRRDGLILVEDEAGLETQLRSIIVEDLQVEDELNEEVREIMREHMDRIRRADVEFHEMFRAIKIRLAKERNIIL